MLTLDRSDSALFDLDRFLQPLPEQQLPRARNRRSEPAYLSEPVNPMTALELWSCERGRLTAQEVRLFTLELTEDTVVSFRAWAQADIDLYVMDRYGQMVSGDNHDDGHPKCLLHPANSGEYLLKLVNNADHAVDYLLYAAGVA